MDTSIFPPYAEATHIVSSRTRPREGQSPELVMIPYRPSRPPEEILSEISSARQTETYRLRDIDIRDVPEYQGEYGDISPIMPKLSRYIPECQTFKGEIKLTQHSRNSLMYEVTMNLLGLEEEEKEEEGKIILGRGNEYIVVSSIGFSEIIQNFLSCLRAGIPVNYYVVSLISDLSGTYQGRPLGHVLVLIIDGFSRIVEIFDPNGISPGTRHVYFWTTQLVNSLNDFPSHFRR